MLLKTALRPMELHINGRSVGSLDLLLLGVFVRIKYFQQEVRVEW